ncbi:DUF3429 domain-containing protein [Vibrio sp. WXL103]|uniref:DUF3429 domain-containing protein n=1 Tax=unclassified Vibrio TaxID=2614977 RepID=UPI003EC4BB43
MKTLLGYMGLVPFLLLPIVILVSHGAASLAYLYTFFIYSGAIAIFMAGANWGRVVTLETEHKSVLLMSNLVTLFVIALSIFSPHNPVLVLIGLIVAHIANLVCEPKLDQEAYMKMRYLLTTGVVLSHCVVVFALWLTHTRALPH